jgi:hypothetical protein
MPDPNAAILTGLLLYGLFGAAGQIVRAIVALGGSHALANGNANQQSLFNAAYFVVTLIVGFVAGLLAGLVAFDTVTQAITVKIALAAMAAGYAGADFVENTYSVLGAALGAGGGTVKRPGGAPNQAPGTGGGQSQSPEPQQPPAAAQAAAGSTNVEERLSGLAAVIAPTPLSVSVSLRNSAAQTTVDMVCIRFGRPAGARAHGQRNGLRCACDDSSGNRGVLPHFGIWQLAEFDHENESLRPLRPGNENRRRAWQYPTGRRSSLLWTRLRAAYGSRQLHPSRERNSY